MKNLQLCSPQDLQAQVSLAPSEHTLTIQLLEAREEPVELFAALDETQRSALAADAWRIGVRAVLNAHKQAEESRLTDIGKTMRDDFERMTEVLTRRQTDTVERFLGEYFDPESGMLAQRLDAFTRDDGELMQRLREVLGPDGGMLADTLARQVGAESPLLRKLDPARKDGLIHELSDAIAKTLADQRGATERMLDPMSENGPLARFFRALKQDLGRAEDDRNKQIKLATAALDQGNPDSLLSRLVKETQQARTQFLQALNLASPSSPLAIIKNSLTQMLSEHIKSEQERAALADKRQREFEADVRGTLERLETKKAHDATSARGGTTFEHLVVEFVTRTFQGAPMTVSPVGNMAGAINRCRTGDVLAIFTAESSYAGCGLVVEAKHDASYTERSAVEEMVEACKNRSAQAGVFVMARSHAPVGFPSFARHGSAVLVVWDPEDAFTDPSLRAALLLGPMPIT